MAHALVSLALIEDTAPRWAGISLMELPAPIFAGLPVRRATCLILSLVRRVTPQEHPAPQPPLPIALPPARHRALLVVRMAAVVCVPLGARRGPVARLTQVARPSSQGCPLGQGAAQAPRAGGLVAAAALVALAGDRVGVALAGDPAAALVAGLVGALAVVPVGGRAVALAGDPRTDAMAGAPPHRRPVLARAPLWRRRHPGLSPSRRRFW